jgi:hypothetical protein
MNRASESQQAAVPSAGYEKLAKPPEDLRGFEDLNLNSLSAIISRLRLYTIMSEAATNTLRLAVCLFPIVTALDFIGPVEVFSFLIPKVIERVGVDTYPEKPRYTLDVTYLAYDLDPMTTAATGPGLLAQRTYEELNDSSIHEQFDILLIPGGTIFRRLECR